MQGRLVSSQSWYKSARFENKIQNENYQKCQVPDLVRRLKHALTFALVWSCLFLAYFIWLICYKNEDRKFAVAWTSIVLLISIISLFLAHYAHHHRIISNFLASRRNLQILGGLLVALLAISNDISAYFNYTTVLSSWIFHIQVTLLLYTCIRAPLIILLLIGLTNSLIFEILRHVNTEDDTASSGIDQDGRGEIPTNNPISNSSIIKLVFAEVFLQLATHCICAKHSNQTDDDLYLSYKRVIDVVKMSAKHEKEKPGI